MAKQPAAESSETASKTTSAPVNQDANLASSQQTGVDTGGGDVNVNVDRSRETTINTDEINREPDVRWEMWTDHVTNFEAQE
jgi:hypothetical protein